MVEENDSGHGSSQSELEQLRRRVAELEQQEHVRDNSILDH